MTGGRLLAFYDGQGTGLEGTSTVVFSLVYALAFVVTQACYGDIQLQAQANRLRAISKVSPLIAASSQLEEEQSQA